MISSKEKLRRERISKNNARYWAGKSFPLWYKKKLSKAAQLPERIAISIKNLPANGYWKGKKLSEEIIKKMRVARARQIMPTGEKSYHWKGGISKRPEYQAFIRQKRRAAKKNSGLSHSLEEWLALKIKYNFMCLCCKKIEPEIKLTEDHIVPLSRGGTNDISNIQPLCFSCNSMKYTKTIDYRISV